MLSFEPKGGVEAEKRFIENTTLPIVTPSLGGVETLITRPTAFSHSGLSPEDRKQLGISDSLIRVSLGIETIDDTIEDFDRALKGFSCISDASLRRFPSGIGHQVDQQHACANA